MMILMKIFISLKVPREDAELNQLADLTTEVLLQAGQEPFIAAHEIADQGLTDPEDFMPFVRQHTAECDLMLVLYHPELRGGLIELGMAYANHIPVWLCHKSGENVSSSARGCADLMIAYKTLGELRANLTTSLREYPHRIINENSRFTTQKSDQETI